ncbi:MAG: outer membrane lipoprotein-sorting protein [Desulfobacteraceae bacterium]|nr:MAG: outer membrane lipoprotein-sorting protein [Desulfobacteraceae bacterium]
MKTVFRLIGLTLMITFLIPPSFSMADDEKAREIMQKVDDRNDGDNQTSEMIMTLIDKNDEERIRKLSVFSKDKGEDTLRLMFFLHPADVKDTSFLTYDYDDPDKDDDQWLYLPALKKTKRIASSDKSDSFMGSDLNYSDMTSRNLEDYDFYLKKETQVRGKDAWVIESKPRSKEIIDETGYTKSLVIVQKDIDFVVRAVNWEKTGDSVKYMDMVKLEQIDGIWVGTEMHVAKKKGNQTVHKTILKFNNVKFNQGLEEDLFTVRRMEKGL